MANNNIHINDIPLDIFLDYFNKVNVNKTVKDETGNLQEINGIKLPKVNQNHEIISKETSFTSIINKKLEKHQKALRKENIINILSNENKNYNVENRSGIYLEKDGNEEELVFYDKVIKTTKYEEVSNTNGKNFSNKLLYNILPSNKEEIIYFKNSIAKLSDYPKYRIFLDEDNANIKPATKIKYNGEYYIYDKVTNEFIKQGTSDQYLNLKKDNGEYEDGYELPEVTDVDDNSISIKYHPSFYSDENREIVYKDFSYEYVDMKTFVEGYQETINGNIVIVPDYENTIKVPMVVDQTILVVDNKIYIYYKEGKYYKNPFINNNQKYDITQSVYDTCKNNDALSSIFTETLESINITDPGFYPIYKTDTMEKLNVESLGDECLRNLTIIYGNDENNSTIYRYRKFSYQNSDGIHKLFDGTRFISLDYSKSSLKKIKSEILTNNEREIVRLSVYFKKAFLDNNTYLPINEYNQVKIGLHFADIHLKKSFIDIQNINTTVPFILIHCQGDINTLGHDVRILTDKKEYFGTLNNNRIFFGEFIAYIDKINDYNFNIRIPIIKVETTGDEKELFCEIKRTQDKKFDLINSVVDSYELTKNRIGTATEKYTETINKIELVECTVKKEILTPVYPITTTLKPFIVEPVIESPVLSLNVNTSSNLLAFQPSSYSTITQPISQISINNNNNFPSPSLSLNNSYSSSPSINLNSGSRYNSFSGGPSLSLQPRINMFSLRRNNFDQINNLLLVYNDIKLTSGLEYKVLYEYETVIRTKEVSSIVEKERSINLSFTDVYDSIDSATVYSLSKNVTNSDQFVIYNSFYLETQPEDQTNLENIKDRFDLTDDYVKENNKLIKRTYFKNYYNSNRYYKKTIEYDNTFETSPTLSLDTKNIIFLGERTDNETFQNIFHSLGKYNDIPIQTFKGKKMSNPLFFEMKKEKLNESLLNILNNKSTNIDIISETVRNDGFINIYNFSKGIYNFVKKDATSVRKIVNENRLLRGLEDINYSFILSEKNVINNNPIELAGPLRITNQNRDFLTRLYNSNLYPLNIKYEKDVFNIEEVETKNSLIDGNINIEAINNMTLPRVPDFQKDFYKENFDNLLMLLTQEIFNFAKNKSIVSKTNLSVDSDYYKMYYQRKINQLSNDFHTIATNTTISNKRLYWSENSVDNLLDDLLKVTNRKHWEVSNE